MKLLKELLAFFPCVAIVGVRQCGKTTLLRQFPSPWRIFDLEKANEHELVARDPDLFLRLHPGHTAIDECQRLPGLFPALRVAIDTARGQKGRFILTGSSSPDLLSSISESLAGRIALLELGPFSLSEATARPPAPLYPLLYAGAPADDYFGLENRIALDTLHDYWLRGGYPEPWIENQPRFTRLWSQGYVQTYLERDVAQLFPGLNRQKYHLFLRMLGSLSGSIINYSQVARALGVSQPTVRDYFQIAHGTFIWRQLPAYERNPSKRIVKHPKGHLRDSGLLHHLLHLTRLDDLLAHPQMGHSWESMVIENLLQGLNSLGAAYEEFHYRTGAGAEVDLVLEGDFGLLPIEIKYGQRVSPRELRGIRDFVAERKCRYGIVIHNGERVSHLDEKLIGIPAGCI